MTMSFREILSLYKHNRNSKRARVWSNHELRVLCPLFSGDIINASGWKDEDKEGGHYRDYFGSPTHYYISNYAGERGLQGLENEIPQDLEAPLDPELEGRFDVVLSHTVLEHVFDVFTAFENLCRMSRDVVIVVVPFVQMYHPSREGSYGHFWLFPHETLIRLFERNGLTTIYGATSPMADSAIYHVYVGSKQPEKWQGKLPDWKPAPRGTGNRLFHRGFLSYFLRNLKGGHTKRSVLQADE